MQYCSSIQSCRCPAQRQQQPAVFHTADRRPLPHTKCLPPSGLRRTRLRPHPQNCLSGHPQVPLPDRPGCSRCRNPAAPKASRTKGSPPQTPPRSADSSSWRPPTAEPAVSYLFSSFSLLLLLFSPENKAPYFRKAEIKTVYTVLEDAGLLHPYHTSWLRRKQAKNKT